MKKLVSLIFLCICLLPVQALTCSTFVLDNNGHPVYGKNADWSPIPAYIFVNKRGVAKTTIPNGTDPVAAWTSKYGSVTFNIYPREIPFEGINEAGLFVSAIGHFDAEYPDPDSRPAISVLRWVQYQLDNFSTVDEVIGSDKDINIPKTNGGTKGSMAGFHYLVSDSKGNSATIEFLDGKIVFHTGETLPVKVLTNTTYDQSLAVLSHFQGFGGYLPIPRSTFWIYLSKYINSYLRFVCAADMLQKFNPQTSGPPVDYAFHILDSITMHGKAKAVWQSVYEADSKKIYFQSWNSQRTRYYDISAFDFSCNTSVKALDVNAELEGDVTNSFVDYTEDMSRELAKTMLQFAPLTNEQLEIYVTYPEKYTHCTE